MAANSSNSNGSSILSPVVGVGVAIIFFALLVWMANGLGGDESVQPKRNFPDAPKAAELRAQEEETLTSYGWVDQEKGTVRIPVERAAELVIEELNQ